MKNRFLALVFIVLLCLSFISVSAGDGGGESKLGIDEAELKQNFDQIETEEVIKLTFTNNVVNLSVKDNNMTCFTMTDENGEYTDFEVLMGDDQENKDIKRIIEIKPISSWQAATTYTLKISGDLEAKNGSLLGADKEIQFTTTGKKSGSGVIYIAAIIAFAIVIGGVVFGAKRKHKA